MTVVTTDGKRLWAFRYSSEGQSRILYYTALVSIVQPGQDVLEAFHPQQS